MVGMISFSLVKVLRFLGGIILVQAVTVIIFFAAGDLAEPRDWALIAAAAAIAVLAAFWFAAMSAHASREAVARAREGFLREREKIKVRAEKEKTRLVEQSQRRISRETSQVQARANFKVGAALVGAVAVGGIMMLTQFFSLGLMLLSGSGGALAGYLARMRQESRSTTRLIERNPPGAVLPSDSAAPSSSGHRER